MIDPQTYSLFVLTALVLVLSPGPDTVLVLSRALGSGTRAGLMTLLGTQLGNVSHALLAGLGISSLVLLIPHAFEILKFAGAAYLIYLAVTTWRASPSLALNPGLAVGGGGDWRHVSQGFTNNIVNPKMIPFFIALFPQFIRPDGPQVALQSAILGVTLAGMALVWIGALVLLVGRFRAAAASSQTFLRWANRLAAATFFGLACRLAMQEKT